MTYYVLRAHTLYMLCMYAIHAVYGIICMYV